MTPRSVCCKARVVAVGGAPTCETCGRAVFPLAQKAERERAVKPVNLDKPGAAPAGSGAGEIGGLLDAFERSLFSSNPDSKHIARLAVEDYHAEAVTRAALNGHGMGQESAAERIATAERDRVAETDRCAVMERALSASRADAERLREALRVAAEALGWAVEVMTSPDFSADRWARAVDAVTHAEPLARAALASPASTGTDGGGPGDGGDGR